MSERFSRWMRGVGKMSQRRLRLNPKSWLRGFFRSGVMQWDRHCAARGVAIGLFWAAPPIPLQMIPAAVFCLLFRGNLPLAIACVWISNPLTYVPIFALEYAIGSLVLGSEGEAVSVEEMAGVRPWEGLGAGAQAVPERVRIDDYGDIWQTLGTNLQELLLPILAGSLVLGITAAIAGYAVTWALWRDRLKAAQRLRRMRRKGRAVPDQAG